MTTFLALLPIILLIVLLLIDVYLIKKKMFKASYILLLLTALLAIGSVLLPGIALIMKNGNSFEYNDRIFVLPGLLYSLPISFIELLMFIYLNKHDKEELDMKFGVGYKTSFSVSISVIIINLIFLTISYSIFYLYFNI